MHGRIVDHILLKKDKQVIKYRIYNGYAVSEKDLEKVRGVQLYTKKDGIIYARRDQFYKHGIVNDYRGERQYILPVKYWEVIQGNDDQMTLL